MNSRNESRMRFSADFRCWLVSLVLSLGLMACAHPPTPADARASDVRVLHVAPPTYSALVRPRDERSCKQWHLSAAQAERFFALSREYREIPYHAFYQVSCLITGEVRSQGKTWAFEIDGGGTATWTAPGSAPRYWGCSVKECEPLVLLLTDLFEG